MWTNVRAHNRVGMVSGIKLRLRISPEALKKTLYPRRRGLLKGWLHEVPRRRRRRCAVLAPVVVHGHVARALAKRVRQSRETTRICRIYPINSRSRPLPGFVSRKTEMGIRRATLMRHLAIWPFAPKVVSEKRDRRQRVELARGVGGRDRFGWFFLERRSSYAEG